MKKAPAPVGTEAFKNQIRNLDFTKPTETNKTLQSLAEAFAKRGHTLAPINPQNLSDGLYASRWGLIRHLPSLASAQAFLRQIGGAV